MKLNHNPNNTKPVFIDIETRSILDLKEVGPNAYWDNIFTEIISMVWLIEDSLNICVPIDLPFNIDATDFLDCFGEEVNHIIFGKETDSLPDDSFTFVGHNVLHFDAIGLSKIGCNPFWFDTIHLCRQCGLPGGLDKVSSMLLNEPKDSSSMMQLLSKIPIRNGKAKPVIGTKQLWVDFIKYNIKDVLLTKRIFHKLIPYYQDVEKDVISIDTVINNKGIPIDRELAKHLIQLHNNNDFDNLELFYKLTTDRDNPNGINPRSNKQVQEWLHKKGFNITSLEKKNLQEFFDNSGDMLEDIEENSNLVEVVEVLKLRQQLTRTGKSKILKMLYQSVSDKCYNQLVYHKGLTGRFAGKGFQPHNFTRGNKDLDIELLVKEPTFSNITREANRVGVNKSEILATLTRTVVKPDNPDQLLGIVDFSQIEGRGVAWLANEKKLLAMFTGDEDIYKIMASKIFKKELEDINKDERFIGKQVVLGCGYGMSSKKFALTCKWYGQDLEKIGVDPKLCVNAYREQFPKIPELWTKIDKACKLAIEERTVVFQNKCKFDYREGNLYITLPSKRIITYWNVRIEDLVPMYVYIFNMKIHTKPTITYTNNFGVRVSLYGGKLVENIVQAFCRDILTTKLIELNQSNFDILLHVHDEIITLLERANYLNRLNKQVEIMSLPVSWFKDFPLECEGFANPCYSKIPFSGFPVVHGKNGKII